MIRSRLVILLVLVTCLALAGPAPSAVATPDTERVDVGDLRETKSKPKKAKKRKRRSRKAKARKKRKKRPRRKSTDTLPNASAKLRRLSPLLTQVSSSSVLAPYSLKRVFRGFGKCRRGKHTHRAIDIGGVGEDGGLGTPIFAMARSKVTLIGRPEEDSRQFGKPDLGRGTVRRGYKGKLVLPKQRVIPGYGRVTFFTKDYGSWRSGTVVCTKVMSGPLAGHDIRYMHLGAVHPSLKRGTVLEVGEELGLMGGTAILDSAPHVHIDITDPNGKRVDVAKLLGLPQAASPCPPARSRSVRSAKKQRKSR